MSIQLLESTSVDALIRGLFRDNDDPPREWHSVAHSKTRDMMQNCIAHLIMQRKSSSSQLDALKSVSKVVERNLYFSASNYEEYCDPRSLMTRLQRMVEIIISEDHTDQRQLLSGDNRGHTGSGGEKSQGRLTTLDVHDHSHRHQFVPIPIVGNSKTEETFDSTFVQEEALRAEDPGQGTKQQAMVSSQGCSKVFIIKVLTAARYVTTPPLHTTLMMHNFQRIHAAEPEHAIGVH